MSLCHESFSPNTFLKKTMPFLKKKKKKRFFKKLFFEEDNAHRVKKKANYMEIRFQNIKEICM